MENLTNVIEDAITDIELPQDDLEASSEPSEPIADPTPDSAPTETPDEPVEAVRPPLDDFEKKFGITAQSSSGRENRIPYSRVKKITDKAVKDAQAEWSKNLETGYTPVTKYAELETKVKDYEGRLAQVTEFENVMVNDHGKFLQMLTRIPGYSEILAPIFNPQTPAPTQTKVETPVDPDADMPQPDERLPDGSMGYSMDGLKALQLWNRAQAKKEAMAEFDTKLKAVEQRYAPLAESYEQYQKVQSVIPHVQKQIQEAREWPLFNESEEDIVKVLRENPAFSLEKAYQTVVFPRFKADRDKMRTEILNEVKAAPRSTGVQGAPVRPAAQTQASGPRRLEDVIADSVKGLR